MHALGYGFVVAPVLVNVLCILLMAIALNWAFKWRRYPASLADRIEQKVPTDQSKFQLERSDLA